MIILKSERDLEAMRPACVVACTVLNEVAAFIQPGLTTRNDPPAISSAPLKALTATATSNIQ